MKITLKGHDFAYETENIIRVFFPFEDLTETENRSREAVSVRTEENGEAKLSAYVKLGSREASAEKSIPVNSADYERECERILAEVLFFSLSELTGYVPDWGILTGVRPSKLMRKLSDSKGEAEAKRYFTKELLVKPEKAELASNVAKAEADAIALTKKDSCSLYAAIPFCPTRCSYCSFVSHSIASAKKLIPDYADKLCRELLINAGIVNGLGLNAETLYIGGGTPTSLTASQLEKITAAAAENTDVTKLREYTVEAGRPDTIDKDKLHVLKNAGVSRISVNPQSFSDKVLDAIGRNHGVREIYEAFALARDAGFENINMDLIAGLPADSVEGFVGSVREAIRLSPENITIHTLALKRSSTLVTEREQDSVCADTSKMLKRAGALLYEAGYYPYYMYRQSKSVGNLENVGWSKKGFEGLYNIYMMEEVHSVFAAGAGAVSKLCAPDGYIERIFNFKYPYEYINRFDELITRKARIAEFYRDKFSER